MACGLYYYYYFYLDPTTNPWGLPPDMAAYERLLREQLACGLYYYYYYFYLDPTTNPWGLPPDMAAYERLLREQLATLPPGSAEYQAKKRDSIQKTRSQFHRSKIFKGRDGKGRDTNVNLHIFPHILKGSVFIFLLPTTWKQMLYRYRYLMLMETSLPPFRILPTIMTRC